MNLENNWRIISINGEKHVPINDILQNTKYKHAQCVVRDIEKMDWFDRKSTIFKHTVIQGKNHSTCNMLKLSDALKYLKEKHEYIKKDIPSNNELSTSIVINSMKNNDCEIEINLTIIIKK